MRIFVGFGLQGRDIVKHPVLKWARVWVSLYSKVTWSPL